MIREWIDLAQRPEFRQRVVFLEDYDIALAQELVQGVDVWVNTPRRPWEACGTSGMKVLVNGGLNLSERDGWWDEAYAPELGWAIGDGRGAPRGRARCRGCRSAVCHPRARGRAGILCARCGRNAAALARTHAPKHGVTDPDLQQQPDGARLCRAILPGRRSRSCAAALPTGAKRRGRCGVGRLACVSIGRGFTSGKPALSRDGEAWSFSVPVYLGEIAPERCGGSALCRSARRRSTLPRRTPSAAKQIIGATNGHIYTGTAPATRSAEEYTVRIVPYFPGVRVPAELPLILWQK